MGMLFKAKQQMKSPKRESEMVRDEPEAPLQKGEWRERKQKGPTKRLRPLLEHCPGEAEEGPEAQSPTHREGEDGNSCRGGRGTTPHKAAAEVSCGATGVEFVWSVLSCATCSLSVMVMSSLV